MKFCFASNSLSFGATMLKLNQNFSNHSKNTLKIRAPRHWIFFFKYGVHAGPGLPAFGLLWGPVRLAHSYFKKKNQCLGEGYWTLLTLLYSYHFVYILLASWTADTTVTTVRMDSVQLKMTHTTQQTQNHHITNFMYFVYSMHYIPFVHIVDFIYLLHFVYYVNWVSYVSFMYRILFVHFVHFMHFVHFVHFVHFLQ